MLFFFYLVFFTLWYADCYLGITVNVALINFPICHSTKVEKVFWFLKLGEPQKHENLNSTP